MVEGLYMVVVGLVCGGSESGDGEVEEEVVSGDIDGFVFGVDYYDGCFDEFFFDVDCCGGYVDEIVVRIFYYGGYVFFDFLMLFWWKRVERCGWDKGWKVNGERLMLKGKEKRGGWKMKEEEEKGEEEIWGVESFEDVKKKILIISYYGLGYDKKCWVYLLMKVGMILVSF